jgi:hypothetical protein
MPMKRRIENDVTAPRRWIMAVGKRLRERWIVEMPFAVPCAVPVVERRAIARKPDAA